MFCGLASLPHQRFTAPCTKSAPHHPCFRFLCKQAPLHRGMAMPGPPPVLFPLPPILQTTNHAVSAGPLETGAE